ncbi:hypothetical protein [Protofrankia symbiont of Coriaria ruscifolia]|uniref:hypothetical protein n=1 Tax=Protofrankia symbiont of Coriaria ruscifolia TaxID=1306542 RepID=UPI001F5F02DE|nr:hypothetical protein [Protofrankia symbiont of Coriaria ruscifolia]
MRLGLSDHSVGSRFVGELEAELNVDLCFVGRVGLGKDGDDVAHGYNHVVDLLFGHALSVGAGVEAGLGGGAFGVGFGGPAGDEGGVGAGFEGEPVALQFGVAVGDRAPCPVERGIAADVGFVVLGCGEGGDRRGQAGRGEGAGKPAVEVRDDEFLADVDAARMLDVVGQGVLVGVDAAVVGFAVVPAALHPPLADPAAHPAS